MTTRIKWVLVGLVIVVAAAGVAVGVTLLVTGGSHGGIASASSRDIHFSVKFPKGWTRVPTTSVTSNPGALLALRQPTAKAALVVRGAGKQAPLGAAMVKKLDTELRAKVADYRPVGASVVNVKAGKALIFTYLRASTREIHSITVIPVGNHSFVIDTVLPATDKQTAREVGSIIHSFAIR